MKVRWNIQTISLCALISASCAIGAFIKIPIPFFDYFTLQFIVVLLAGLLLGPRLGAISILLYVVIGLLGIPVFASGGGPGYIVQPSFGYLLGFIAGAWMSGFIIERGSDRFRWYIIAVFGGLLVTYAIGLSYKYMILNFYTGEVVSWKLLVLSCFPIDFPGDVLLAGCAAMLAFRLQHIHVITRSKENCICK